MELSNEPRTVIDITDSSDDDQDIRFEEFINAEELQAAVHRSLNSETPASAYHNFGNPYTTQLVPTPAVAPYDECIQKVLEIFPDVCHDYVRSLYDRYPPNTLSPDGIPRSEQIISQILDGVKYPKERDRQNELKRKRTQLPDSDDERAAKWASIDNVTRPAYENEAIDALIEDFPDIPRKFIELKFGAAGNLYATYLALDIADDTYSTSAPRPYTRLKKARKSKQGRPITSSTMDPTGYGLTELQNELEAARAQRKKFQTQRQIKRDAEAAEAAEEKELRDNKQVIECGSCFDEVPINKITFCNGDEPHSACFECVTTWVKTKIGESRHQVPCIVDAGCRASYSRHERTRFLDIRTIEKLERLEQQTCLREANLPNLEECPFCDFAAECPPVEVDKEFRCGNPECQKVSCRKCKVATHIPLSCEEFKKENGLTERHQIEEARTQALLRRCPRCKKTIMKDHGCNKMTCACGAYICDYCGKDITKEVYNHFSDGPTAIRVPGLRGKCPTHDDDYTRNKQNMDKAEKEAQDKIRKENPNISEEDLKIRMKDSVRSPKVRARNLVYPPHVGGVYLPPMHLAPHVAGARPPGAHGEHMGHMPAAGNVAQLGAFPPGYPHPNHGAPHGGPPMGHFAPPQYAAPLYHGGPHDERRRQAQNDVHSPGPRHRRNAIADQGGRAGRAQAGGHALYHGPAHFGGMHGNGLDMDFGALDEGLDDLMAEYMEAMGDVEAARPRRRRH
ncbi:MAG: hypothetical protein Q9209_004522 [Squamulea sp. 1 TL-2023]